MDNTPDLSVRQLKAIVAVARFESFIAAASYLDISQSGLTRLVQQAEKLVGAQLFVRGTRKIMLTDAGELMARVSERVLNDLGLQVQAARAMDGELRGQVSISSLMSVSHRVLPEALMAFRGEHPNVHIQVRERLGGDVLNDVRRGTVDFGIANVENAPADLNVIASVDEACFLIVSNTHALCSLKSVAFQRLADEPLISMPTESGLRTTIDAAASSQGIALTHSIIINQFSSLFDFVSSGLGAAIVPALALPRETTSAFAVKPLRPKLTRKIGILHLKDRPLTSIAAAFLELFEPLFKGAIR